MFSTGNIPHLKVRAWQIAIGALVVVLGLVPSSALPAQARQAYIRHPELIEGPWEFTARSGKYGLFSNGQYGLFFTIETSWRDPIKVTPCPGGGCNVSREAVARAIANPRTIKWQTVSLRCYRPGYSRQYGGDYSRSLLSNRFTLGCWGSLDVVFHPGQRKWTGTWNYRGTTRSVVLTRPHPARGVKRNPFVGDWIGLPNEKTAVSPGSLHIMESSEGTLIAWLDQKLGAVDCQTHSVQISQTNGGVLHVFSAAHGRISMQTTNAMGPPFRYMGRLSEGGTEIVGAWSSHDGAHFDAPGDFRRIP